MGSRPESSSSLRFIPSLCNVKAAQKPCSATNGLSYQFFAMDGRRATPVLGKSTSTLLSTRQVTSTFSTSFNVMSTFSNDKLLGFSTEFDTHPIMLEALQHFTKSREADYCIDRIDRRVCGNDVSINPALDRLTIVIISCANST